MLQDFQHFYFTGSMPMVWKYQVNPILTDQRVLAGGFSTLTALIETI
jgi:hypothetical protein